MRSNRLVAGGWIVLLLFFLQSCDTVDNVKSPNSFVKYFGAAGDQEGVDLVVNQDGTILLFGNTTLPGELNPKLYLAKSDANGNLLWELPAFGGPLKNQARDIEVTTDGRIVLLATSEIADGDNDILLITVDQNGKELKRVTHGYPITNEDASTVTQTTDGFIVTGSTTRTTQSGNPADQIDERDAFNFRFYDDLSPFPKTWKEILGLGTFDAGTKVVQVAPDLFYFFGYTNTLHYGHSIANFNFWAFEINNEGEGLTDYVYAGDDLVDEKLTSVTGSPEGGFLLTGIRTDASGVSSIYIARLIKDISQPDQALKFPSKVVSTDIEFGQLQDLRTASVSSLLSGFLVVSNESSLGNQNLYLTKITDNGTNAWNTPKGFTFGGSNSDKIGSVAELPDGNILMIGTFSVGDDLQQKMTLIKVNKDGKFD